MSRTVPLIAFRTFIEVSKMRSMKRASQNLCVSPGAISQQIKALEDRVGARLFERDKSGLDLTASGCALYNQLLNAFNQIEIAWADLKHKLPHQHRLVINTTASIASSWLIPRLANFNECWPQIEVSIEVSPRMVDLKHGHVDVTLRHGSGDYPGHCVTHLWCSKLIPVCSPSLLEGKYTVTSPRDCLEYPLLQDGDRQNWKLWLNAFEVHDKRATSGTSFCDEFLLIRAASAGHGIALVSDVFVSQELASGRLVQVLHQPCPTRFAYYLVAAKERSADWAVATFRNWIIEQTDSTHNPSVAYA